MPRVSIITPVYNCATHIAETMASVAAQTLTDYEHILINDGSSDGTAAMIDAASDARCRVFHRDVNRGLIASRNLAAAAATGEFIAVLDHDDLWHPEKLAKQVALLDSNPLMGVVGTHSTLIDTRSQHIGYKRNARYMGDALRIGQLFRNNFVHSSIMVRRALIHEPMYVDEFQLCEDYNLIYQIGRTHDIAIIHENLTRYRLHDSFGHRKRTLMENYARQMKRQMLLGLGLVPNEAEVEAHHKIEEPGDENDDAFVSQIRDWITRLYHHVIALPLDNRADITTVFRDEWVNFCTLTFRDRDQRLKCYRSVPFAQGSQWWNDPNYLKLSVKTLIPLSDRTPDAQVLPAAPLFRSAQMIDLAKDSQPRVLVFIDTEEDFDWNQPISRNNVGVESMRSLEIGHRLLCDHKITPHYLIDYPIATSQLSIDVLQPWIADGSCVIGSQLHPWVNPPFDEQVTVANSYPGNLPVDIERAKLANLTQAICDSFNIQPRVYRAGRYGIGPNTSQLLKSLGYTVDVSARAHFDYSASGGPSFRHLDHQPCWLDEERQLLELPLSNVFTGPLAPWHRNIFSHAPDNGGHSWSNAVLGRTRLLNRLGLTPEGMSVSDAQRAVRQLHALGCKIFCISFHSPSLEPGNTPYVRNASDLKQFLTWLHEVLDYLHDEIGAEPTTAEDLREELLGNRVSPLARVQLVPRI